MHLWAPGACVEYALLHLAIVLHPSPGMPINSNCLLRLSQRSGPPICIPRHGMQLAPGAALLPGRPACAYDLSRPVRLPVDKRLCQQLLYKATQHLLAVCLAFTHSRVFTGIFWQHVQASRRFQLYDA